MPEIKGNEQDFVFSGDEMRALVLAESNPTLRSKISAFTRFMTYMGARTGVTGWQRLSVNFKVMASAAQKIVIIGSELVGLELAEFLAERGREVTVIDEQKKAGKGLYIVRRMRLLTELKEAGVMIINKANHIKIGIGNVTYTDAHDQSHTFEVQQVIVAKEVTGNEQLAVSLKNAGFNVQSIGDCNGVGYIEGAMEAAAELAIKLSNEFENEKNILLRDQHDQLKKITKSG